MLAERRADDKEQLDAFLWEDLRTLGVRRVLLEGDPAPPIMQYTGESNPDMIV
jgi:hypothetical protein